LTNVKQIHIFQNFSENTVLCVVGGSCFAWVLPHLDVDGVNAVPDTATFDDTPAGRLQGGIDQFCSGLGFVHGAQSCCLAMDILLGELSNLLIETPNSLSMNFTVLGCPSKDALT
jgi:hypothetical protein